MNKREIIEALFSWAGYQRS